MRRTACLLVWTLLYLAHTPVVWAQWQCAAELKELERPANAKERIERQVELAEKKSKKALYQLKKEERRCGSINREYSRRVFLGAENLIDCPLALNTNGSGPKLYDMYYRGPTAKSNCSADHLLEPAAELIDQFDASQHQTCGVLATRVCRRIQASRDIFQELTACQDAVLQLIRYSRRISKQQMNLYEALFANQLSSQAKSNAYLSCYEKWVYELWF